MKQCNNLRHISDSSYDRFFIILFFILSLFRSWKTSGLDTVSVISLLYDEIGMNCRLVFWISKWQYCLLESQCNIIWCAVHPKVALLKICTSELKIIIVVVQKDREKREEHHKQYTYKRNIENCLRNQCYRVKAVNITYSVCVSVPLGMKHAKCTRQYYIVICGLVTLPYFSHYLVNDTILGKVLLNIKYVLFFSTSFAEIFFILSRIERDIIINVHRSSCNVAVIFVRL
jgi:hypothetical protein